LLYFVVKTPFLAGVRIAISSHVSVIVVSRTDPLIKIMAETIIHSVLLFNGHTFEKTPVTVTFSSSSGTILSISKDKFEASSAPKNATVIDGSGHTLLPGLIEGHMHVHGMHLPPGGDESNILITPLKCGVTTLCDMFSDTETVQARRAEIKADLDEAKASGKNVTMSDLKSCILAATIEGGWPKPIVLGHHPTEELIAKVKMWPNLTADTAPEFITSNKANGANYIKLMQENCCSMAIPTNSIPCATLEFQTAVVKAAHAQDLLVVGHATSVESTEIVLNAGADGLTHTFIDQAPTQSIVDLYKKTNAFLIPTLSVLSSITNEAGDLRQKFVDAATKKGLLDDYTRQNMLDVIGLKAETAQLEYGYESVRRLKKEGIDIVAGTDAVAGLKGTAIGPSLWMELQIYVEKCGMSVEEALATATGVSAKRFRFGDRGEVSEGKRGDLMLVKGDLSKGLENLWAEDGIVGVWKEGIKAA
jgi:imidazolonepropionase-like amidohydrolase